MGSKRLSAKYVAYLQSEHWQHLRRAALFDDRGRPRPCQCCMRPDRIQAHHVVYRRLYDCLPCDLVALCDKCHDAFHFAKDDRDFSQSGLASLPDSERAGAVIAIIKASKAKRHLHQRQIRLNTLYLRRQRRSSRFLSYSEYQEQYPPKKPCLS